MDNKDTAVTPQRNIWARGLFMLMFALIYHVIGTVLCVVVAIQFLLALFGDGPNARLIDFGHNLARYLKQIVLYLAFATEEAPFPFSDWPAEE